MDSREEVQRRFSRESALERPSVHNETTIASPCKRYTATRAYWTNEAAQVRLQAYPLSGVALHDIAFSTVRVNSVADGKVIADLSFDGALVVGAWVDHPNGSTYLVVREHRHGYKVLNLTQRSISSYVADPHPCHDPLTLYYCTMSPSPNSLVLAVDGFIHKAEPYDTVTFYDFARPDVLPLPVIDWFWYVEQDPGGWNVDGEFVFQVEHEVRKSDGAMYYRLDRDVQDELDRHQELEERKEIIRWRQSDHTYSRHPIGEST